MPTFVKRKCDFCKDEYVGTGKKFCSTKCAMMDKEKGTIEKLKQVDVLASKLTSHFRLSGDYIITSDWHLPLIDSDIVLKMILIAKKFKIKKLAIVGDFINFETISKWEVENTKAALELDLIAAEDTLTILFDWFERIDWCFGNHDERLSRLFNFQLNPGKFGKMICDQIGKKLFISSHPYMELNNGSVWRLTHPKNFSIITARVPTQMSQKYRCNVLGAHGHHLGFCFDASGTDICGDLGCMTDYEKTHYIIFKDTTHPKWNKGFGMVRNGCYYQFSSNAKATDWDFWLNDVYIKNKQPTLALVAKKSKKNMKITHKVKIKVKPR